MNTSGLFISLRSVLPTLFSLALITAAHTAAISGLYNTGVNSAGIALPDINADPHYTIISAPVPDTNGPAFVTITNAGTFPGGWFPDSATAQWISPHASQSGPVEPLGQFDYRLTFTLMDATGKPLNPTNAIITGTWATDNSGDILFNGVTVANSSSYSYSSLSAFTINSGFVRGTNTIDFIVTNAPGGSGNTDPSGLIVSGISGYASNFQSAPIFLQTPTNEIVGIGQGFAFQSSAIGLPRPSYQWQFSTNGVSYADIGGATSADYQLASSSLTNVGYYQVKVFNSQGTNVSFPATLIVFALNMFAGVVINGPTGAESEIQSLAQLGSSSNWLVLTNVMLQTQPYIYIDYSSPTNSKQFYRVVTP
jgi:hypothetical protein